MNRSGEGKVQLKEIFVNVLSGVVPGILVALLVMYISALLIYSGKLNEELGDVIVTAAVLAGACIGTFITAKRQGSGNPLLSLIGGGIYLTLILAVSAMGKYEALLWSRVAKTGVCAVIGGVTGSALSLPRGKRRKNRKAKQYNA